MESDARGQGTLRPATGQDRRQDLLHEILLANGDVQDPLDMAATIESLGWTDRQVDEAFGQPTVFDLAQDLYQEFLNTVRNEPVPPRLQQTWWQMAFEVAHDFIHGLVFALPMAVSVTAMVILHISIFSYLYFSVPEATAIAVATFFSFVVTGGYYQAMAVAFYTLSGLREAGMAERTLTLIMRWGFFSAVVVAVLLAIGNTIFPMLPFELELLLLLYMLVLSVLWLAFAGLYVLRREFLITAITAGAILIAYILWKCGFAVVLAQVIAMLSAACVSVVTWFVLFRRRTRSWQHGGRIVRMRMSQLAYLSSTYFSYGVLYFVFIFVDRLIAWTTSTTFLPYTIWFRGQYELGMDWALFALILPLGAGEALVGHLVRWLMATQHRVAERNVAELSRAMRSVYFRSLGIFLIVALAVLILLRFAISLAQGVPILRSALPLHGVEPFVFLWASIAYVFLALALFNVLFLFSLAYPLPALRTILISLGADIVFGIVITRITGAYQYAVLGLAVGVACLVVLTTREVLRALPQVDFMLYRMV